jgi:4-hydroxybenzoate polyprenyltransferase
MSQAQAPKTDIPQRSWIDAALPARALPYARLMRLDRPIGTWLLLWPCVWALVLAGAGLAAWHFYVLFALGAVVMRGAGCTYNDIIDRDIDARVQRTAARPLPSGQITPTQAWVFLGLQLFIGLMVLLQFNITAIFVGAASLLLVFTYPFMKRITYWPQAWLGLTFNWGALVGWAAATGEISGQAALLYAGGILWTLGYDTIYAHQDREDDELVGVKSSALALRVRTKPFVAICYGLALLLFALAIPAGQWSILVVLVMAAAMAHAGWQVATLNINDAANCLMRFRSNRDLGALIALAHVASQIKL